MIAATTAKIVLSTEPDVEVFMLNTYKRFYRKPVDEESRGTLLFLVPNAAIPSACINHQCIKVPDESIVRLQLRTLT